MLERNAISLRLVLSVAAFCAVVAAASLSGAHRVDSPRLDDGYLSAPPFVNSYSTTGAPICAPTNAADGASATGAVRSDRSATLLSCLRAAPPTHGHAAPAPKPPRRTALA
jgi:hypothetical protein